MIIDEVTWWRLAYWEMMVHCSAHLYSQINGGVSMNQTNHHHNSLTHKNLANLVTESPIWWIYNYKIFYDVEGRIILLICPQSIPEQNLMSVCADFRVLAAFHPFSLWLSTSDPHFQIPFTSGDTRNNLA